MKTMSSLAIGAAVLVMTSPVTAQETWSLLPEDATCLIDNLDGYIAADGEPIIIMLRACPIVDRTEALRSLQQNSGAQPRVRVAPDGSAIDEVIVYTQAELTCLRELSLETSGLPVLLPQAPCD
jgi:hypothetical protein